jgi:hypothetical protein
MNEQLLEIGIYFDKLLEKNMSIKKVADHLVCLYPLEYFKGKHNLSLKHPQQGSPGFLVLYSHLVTDPQIDFLQGLKNDGLIKSWAVFPPDTWSSFF